MIRAAALLTLAMPASATPSQSPFGLPLQGASAPTAALQVVLLLTALTFLPALIVALTPFLRITIVLHFLRQALGTQTSPSNQVLLGLSLFLSFLIMQPVASEAYQRGWEPFDQGRMSGAEAWAQGSQPVKRFLLRFAREKDIALLLEISKSPAPQTPKELDLKVLAPAYVLSELRAGFQIGAVVFLPFLVIDLVVASVTLSIGMVQLPPVMVSAPFKILLFVLVDGWNLVIGSLMRSFA
ncbi:MAG TPA: flagellar type III secretion system pore protein FliP [Bryobacteraceae bacterium]|nr:flagellar type III secretion system pore protein FliP [Bryobacteraceae bacterium]HPT27926.1 flagellar type III secretion system pore protein FliP [Bryobacteraceae bacterium]